MGTPFAVVKLMRPVQFGRDAEPVTELALQATGRAMRDLTIPMGEQGSMHIMLIKPYDLALVGLKMAGIAGDKAFVDLMDPRDIQEVSSAVVGFLFSGPTTGSSPSPS